MAVNRGKPSVAARSRQPMSAAETRALIRKTAEILLGSMNELETRIVALEQQHGHRPESGLILPPGVP